jgi:hypothetical protein
VPPYAAGGSPVVVASGSGQGRPVIAVTIRLSSPFSLVSVLIQAPQSTTHQPNRHRQSVVFTNFDAFLPIRDRPFMNQPLSKSRPWVGAGRKHPSTKLSK